MCLRNSGPVTTASDAPDQEALPRREAIHLYDPRSQKSMVCVDPMVAHAELQRSLTSATTSLRAEHLTQVGKSRLRIWWRVFTSFIF